MYHYQLSLINSGHQKPKRAPGANREAHRQRQTLAGKASGLT